MTKQFVSIEDLPLEEITELYSRRSLVGEKEMISWATMKAGMHAATHSHPHEQIFWILSGAMEFRIGDEKRLCRAGDLVLVPPNAEHEAWCPEDTDFVTILAPPREDLQLGAELPDHLKQS